MNVRTALLGLFVALTIVFASTTVYESGTRTTLTSTSTATSVSTITSTTTQTTTLISTFDLIKGLTDAYLSHISAIKTENVTVLATQYETNATLVYVRSIFDLTNGSEGGIQNVTRFYEVGGPLGGAPLAAPFAVANVTYSVTISHDGIEGNVTSRLIFYGNDTRCPAGGIMQCSSGTAFYSVTGFDISYVLQGDRWLISTEHVTNLDFGQCKPVSLSPDGSVLTCPTFQGPS